MTLRTRLLLIFTLPIAATVGLVELLVLGSTRDAFERADRQRAQVLVAQFRNEFARRRQEIVRAVNGIAASDAALNIALASDYALYHDEASALAAAHGLDLLQLVAGDGTIISSAEWPARFGYKEDWLTAGEDWKRRGAFLRREERCGRAAPSFPAGSVSWSSPGRPPNISPSWRESGLTRAPQQ